MLEALAGITIAAALLTADAVGPQQWSYEVTPAAGEAFLTASAEVAADGLKVGGEDGRSISWSDLRRLSVIPPEGWKEGSGILIREDGKIGVTSNEATIKLRAKSGSGYHHFHLAYVHFSGSPTLKLEIKGPPFPTWQEVPASLIYQPREQGSWNAETESTGYDEEGFRLPEKPTSLKRGLNVRVHAWEPSDAEPVVVRDIRSTPLLGYTAAASFRVPTTQVKGRDLDEQFACVLYGLIRIPRDGEYAFRITSDGLAQLAIGGWPPDLPERTREPKETEWDVSLGYEGHLRGTLASFEGDVLSVRPQIGLNDQENADAMPLVPVHRDIVRELWRTKVGEEIERVEESADSDVLYAAGRSGEVRGVAGTLKSIGAEELTFELDGEDRSLPLDRVRGVVFAKSPLTDVTGTPAVADSSGPVLRLDLHGPTVIPGHLLSVEDYLWRFRPLGGETETTVERRYVDGVDVSGGRSVSLTEMAYEAERTPYFDLPPVLTVNETLDAGPLRVGAERFREFFVAGPKTSLTFRLDGAFNKLRTRVGMPAPVKDRPPGNLRVRVLSGDEVLFERESLTPGDGAVDVEADVSGRKALTLEVDFGPGGDTGDVVVWGDPELLREGS